MVRGRDMERGGKEGDGERKAHGGGRNGEKERERGMEKEKQ
jgi:hypothetical protein